MQVHDITELMKTDPAFEAQDDDGAARFWCPAPFNDGMMWVGTFTGTSPWEMHPDSDELVHVLEGESVVTILTDDGPVTATMGAGSMLVVPRGHWHRQSSPGGVTECGVTPGPTEHSDAEDPRVG